MIVPESQVRPVLGALAARTLQAGRRARQLEDAALLLVPDAHGRRRTALLRALADRGAVAGPARPWLEVRRVVRPGAAGPRRSGSSRDTEATSPSWC